MKLPYTSDEKLVLTSIAKWLAAMRVRLFHQITGNRLLILYCLLVVHWVLFINYGKVDFYSFDWYAMHQWLDVAKLALQNHVIPYEVRLWSDSGPSSELFGTKYFAMPFLVASPQVLMLRWVSVQSFATIQIVLAMSASFYSLVLWKRHLHLSSFSAAVLILMWSLNGALVARMGVGHIQLTGYFLIPAFIYGMKLFLDSTKSSATGYVPIRNALFLSCILFAVLLQGSVHTVYQMSLIGVLFGIVFVRSLKYVMLTFAVFTLLASYFIFPNALFSGYSIVSQGADVRQVFGGYGVGFSEILRSVAGITLPEVDRLASLTATNFAWPLMVHCFAIVSHLFLALAYPFTAWTDASWEYSVYIGPVGVLLMIVGLYEFLSRRDSSGRLFIRGCRKEVVLVAIVFILSLSVSSRAIFNLIQQYVPLNAIDRLPTRMFLYPFFVLLLCMCIGLDHIRLRMPLLNHLWIKLGVLVTLACFLLANSFQWSFHNISMTSQVVEHFARQDKPVFATRIMEVTDPAYRAVVNAGFAVSLLAGVGVIGALVFLQRRIARHRS